MFSPMLLTDYLPAYHSRSVFQPNINDIRTLLSCGDITVLLPINAFIFFIYYNEI